MNPGIYRINYQQTTTTTTTTTMAQTAEEFKLYEQAIHASIEDLILDAKYEKMAYVNLVRDAEAKAELADAKAAVEAVAKAEAAAKAAAEAVAKADLLKAEAALTTARYMWRDAGILASVTYEENVERSLERERAELAFQATLENGTTEEVDIAWATLASLQEPWVVAQHAIREKEKEVRIAEAVLHKLHLGEW
jgi:hypothetical protein